MGELPARRDHLAGPEPAVRQPGPHAAPVSPLRRAALRASPVGTVQPGHDLPGVPGAAHPGHAPGPPGGADGGPARPAGGAGAALRDPADRPRRRSVAGQRQHLRAAAAARDPGAARRRARRPARRRARHPGREDPGERHPGPSERRVQPVQAGGGGARPRLLRAQRHRADRDGLLLPGVHPRPGRSAVGADDRRGHRPGPERRRRDLRLQEAAAGVHLGGAGPPARAGRVPARQRPADPRGSRPGPAGRAGQ